MSLPAARSGLISAGVLLALNAVAAEPEVSLTVYSSAQPGGIPAEWYRPLPGMGTPQANQLPGFALVRLDRELQIPRGRGTIQFTDVAALIDPTTVQFLSLTDPEGTKVLEQNFQFDLVSQEKLLSRYIDRQVSVEQQSGDGIKVVDGTLVSSNDGLVIRGADGQIHALREWSNMRFGELPGGLITRPTLEWDVVSGKGGTQEARVSYQTGGITWWADYNLIFTEGADANSGFVDVGAWVSLLNQSGARYQDAKLKLIAGDVHRAQPPPQVLRKEVYEMSAVADAAAPGFEEKAFFEYHLYTLGRPATIPNNSTKQIELFDSATRVPAKKQLVYYGADFGGYYGQPMMEREMGPASNTKVDVWLKFRQRQGIRHGNAAACGPNPRLATGQGRRQPRVHRRGHDRPHAEGRGRARQARHRLRRRRRAPADRLRPEHEGPRDGRGLRDQGPQPQGAGGRGDRAREPLSLEPVVAHRAVFALREEGREDSGIPGARGRRRRVGHHLPRALHVVKRRGRQRGQSLLKGTVTFNEGALQKGDRPL